MPPEPADFPPSGSALTPASTCSRPSPADQRRPAGPGAGARPDVGPVHARPRVPGHPGQPLGGGTTGVVITVPAGIRHRVRRRRRRRAKACKQLEGPVLIPREADRGRHRFGPGRPAGGISRRGRVLATLAVGVALLAAGCGGGGGSPHASLAIGSPGTGCLRPLHALARRAELARSPAPGRVPSDRGRRELWPPGPFGDEPASTCSRPIPAERRRAGPEAGAGAEGAKCMRTHGFPGFPDPSVRNNGSGPFITSRRASTRARRRPRLQGGPAISDSRRDLPRADRSSSMSITIGTRSSILQGGGS